MLKNPIVKSILFFLSLLLCGILLLCAAYALPTEKTCLHVRESGETLELEGDYYQMLPDDEYTRLDNFTDAIMLLTASYSGRESILEKVINNYRVYVKNESKAVSCKMCGLEMESKSTATYTYARYWHGYIVILKPLLLFLNLTEIRQLNLFVILLEIAAAGILMYRRKAAAYVAPFSASIAFLNPVTISASLQNSTVFHIMMAAVLAELALYGQKRFRQNLYLYFLCIGMLTSYMDLLTYPVITLAYPLIFYFMLSNCPKIVENIGRLFLHSVMWCLGYGGMWVSKWVLATLLTGKNHIQNGIANVLIRSGSDVGENVSVGVWDVYEAIWKYFSQSKIWALLLLILIVEAALFLVKKKHFDRWAVSLMLACVSLYPFVWYACTKNHSYIHRFFTHRGMSAFIMGTASILLPNITKETGMKESHKETDIEETGMEESHKETGIEETDIEGSHKEINIEGTDAGGSHVDRNRLLG